MKTTILTLLALTLISFQSQASSSPQVGLSLGAPLHLQAMPQLKNTIRVQPKAMQKITPLNNKPNFPFPEPTEPDRMALMKYQVQKVTVTITGEGEVTTEVTPTNCQGETSAPVYDLRDNEDAYIVIDGNICFVEMNNEETQIYYYALVLLSQNADEEIEFSFQGGMSYADSSAEYGFRGGYNNFSTTSFIQNGKFQIFPGNTPLLSEDNSKIEFFAAQIEIIDNEGR